MKIGRFFVELFNPKQKCDRVGHNFKEKHVKIRKKDEGPYPMWAVKDYRCTIGFCTRCNARTEPKDLIFHDGYNKCTMPTNMWDEIEMSGYTIMRYF